MENIFIELWNHGTAGEPEKPCGEVDVFSTSGGRLDSVILKELINDTSSSLKIDWFSHLPTEECLKVEVSDVSTEDGIWLEIIAWSFCDKLKDNTNE